MGEEKKQTKEMPPELIDFIENQVVWIWAKTYDAPDGEDKGRKERALKKCVWSHYYITRYQDSTNVQLFEQLVAFVRDFGYKAKFFNSRNIYYDFHAKNGRVYSLWTMTGIPSFSKVLNSCLKELTYSERLKNLKPGEELIPPQPRKRNAKNKK